MYVDTKKMKFLDQGFQKLKHKQETHRNRQIRPYALQHRTSGW